MKKNLIYDILAFSTLGAIDLWLAYKMGYFAWLA